MLVVYVVKYYVGADTLNILVAIAVIPRYLAGPNNAIPEGFCIPPPTGGRAA